jgi:Tol biopolymer transport system component
MPAGNISHYRIIGKLGAGGMGVVYRAEDLRLGRPVALKFLPEELAEDKRAFERIRREARAAAAINHPNICTIYEVADDQAQPFLAMELLEGATLRERIGNKPLALDPLLKWALQIADGLEAAHSRDIVHRDIKPSNLFVTGDAGGYSGQVKILDFGLAKPAVRRAAAVSEQTVTLAPDTLTPPGAAAGTPGYMSPEQIRGEELDARTDLFSLGVVLYEMATGQAAFQGKTPGAVLGAVLHETPRPPTSLNPQVPPELLRIIYKALEKDRDIRYQHASDLRADLARLQRDVASAHTAAATKPASRPNASWALALAVLLAAISAALVFLTRPVPQPRVKDTVQITNDGLAKGPFATDGSRLYYSGRKAGGERKFFQISAKGGEPVAMPQLDGMIALDVSPDGSQLLLIKPLGQMGNLTLWVASTLGGVPLRLGNLETAYDARWSPKGDEILYGTNGELRIARGDGSESRRVIAVKGTPYTVCWSPDGRTVRFSVEGKGTLSLWDAGVDGSHLTALFPDWKDRWQAGGDWTPDARYFIFSSDSDIWIRREGGSSFRKSNRAPERLTIGPMRALYPRASHSGKRIFFYGILQRGELVRYDSKSDRWIPYLSGLAATELDYSHDGKSLVYVEYPGGTVWRSAPDGGQRVQLTAAPLDAAVPKWSPDDTQIAFLGQSKDRAGRIFVVPAAGGAVQELTNGESGPAGDSNPEWSPDGAAIVFSPHPLHSEPGAAKVVLRTVDIKSRRIAVLPGSEGLWAPRWSPDGRYIAALGFPRTGVMLYDVATHRQTELAAPNAGWPSWSRDGQFVYFTDQWKDWCRVRVKDRKIERLASLKSVRLAPSGVGWIGLAPDNALICTLDTSTTEIYALDWESP